MGTSGGFVMRLRVLTLNVQNDDGDARRMEILNRGLRDLKPDLVAVQEVVQAPDRHQLAELLDGTGLHGSHQADVLAYQPPWADKYGGNAVATRWPHRIVETLDLRLADAPDVPWCTLAASVTLPDLGDLLFIATTTSWRLDAESARERQAIALTELDARHRQTLPTVIAGDLNASPDAASIRYLSGLQSLNGHSVYYHDAWAVAGDGPGHTWTIDNPGARTEIEQLIGQPGHRRRVDYVFVGSRHAHPAVPCRIMSATLAFDRPADGIWASDHFGVVVDLELSGADR
jgi:endonuclease/exonuclease/phosphatase family metal-dependent hydrolase